MDVQDMGLPELSKNTQLSHWSRPREKRKCNSLYPPGAECPLGPPGIRAEVGFSLLLAHLCQWFDVVQGTPGSPLRMWESKF